MALNKQPGEYNPEAWQTMAPDVTAIYSSHATIKWSKYFKTLYLYLYRL